jgi:replicative DNA helicase
MEILTRGVTTDKGEQLHGHADARLHILTRFADLDRDLSMQQAPEGDMRGEGRDILAEYAAQELAHKEGRGGGVQFGVPALDDKVGGLHKGALALVVGYTSDGKAQDVDAPVLTPTGWTRMGDLRVGDAVVDPKGEYSGIQGIYPQGVLPIYRLTFSDGSVAEATGDHLWSVRAWRGVRELQTERGVRGRQSQKRLTLTMTTEQLRVEMASATHRTPVLDTSEGLASVDLGSDLDLPIEPYVLGLLIGDAHLDGTPSFTNAVADAELVESLAANLPSGVSLSKAQQTGTRTPSHTLVGVVSPVGECAKCGRVRARAARGLCRPCYTTVSKARGLEAYVLTGKGDMIMRGTLTSLGLYGTRSWNKFVPERYKWTSARARLAVLQGLMDTDGGHERGRATFSSASEQLRDDVVWLARSLGLRAAPMKDKIPTYKYKGVRREGRTAYRCSIWETAETRVFRLARKIRPIQSRDAGRIPVSIEHVRDAEAQCISVTAPSKMYVTNDFVPTHNTSLCVQLAWSAVVQQNKNVLFLTTETIRSQVRRRIVARHSCLPIFGAGDGLNSRDIKDGTLSQQDRDRLGDVVRDFDDNPGYGRLYIAQVPRGASMGYIESKALRVGRQMHIDLVVMDYLALLKPERKRNTDREELSGILKAAKQMSTTLNDGEGVPFVSPWQVSRTARAEAEKLGYYTLNALSETAETSNSADDIISLLAPLDNQDRQTKVRAQLMKHRDGAKANSIELMVDYATSRFSGLMQAGTDLDNVFDPLGISSYGVRL